MSADRSRAQRRRDTKHRCTHDRLDHRPAPRRRPQRRPDRLRGHPADLLAARSTLTGQHLTAYVLEDPDGNTLAFFAK
jgi:hypothetical protein